MVPKDLEKNLDFRAKVVNLGSESQRNAEDIWHMCGEDPLFWFNTFAFVYRGDIAQTWPFITWPFQDEDILKFVASIGRNDVRVMKSRDMGFSYMATYIPTWGAQFHNDTGWLFASYKEAAVDNPRDPDCLFWKIDFCLRNQPGWLVGPVERAALRVYFADTGSMVSGTATTRTVATGGRRLVVILDELAKWQPHETAHSAVKETQAVTKSRWFISTPKGANSAHALLRNAKACQFIERHWSDHPEHSAGLYRTHSDGRIEILDKAWHESNPGYAFREEPGHWKGLRSPYYDEQCDRASVPEIAYQELDMDELGSDFQFFDQSDLDDKQSRFARDPGLVGRIEYDPETGAFAEFVEDASGPLRLWIGLDEDNRPPAGDYVIGADTAQGTGASPSVLSVGESQTGAQVAEFASNHLRPDQFATAAVALASWFHNAQLVPERNGPGEGFIHRAVELGWRNFYYKRPEARLNSPAVDEVGIWNQGGTRTRIFEEMRAAVRNEMVSIRSAEVYEEASQYVYGAGQKIAHSAALGKSNPSDSGDNHGDRLIAAVMMWWGMRHRKMEAENELPPEPPKNSPKGRYLARMRALMDSDSVPEVFY